MEESIQITLLKSMTGEDDDTVLAAYLSLAEQSLMNRLYPYKTVDELSGMQFPSQYDAVKVRAAAYMLNKRGAEGETSHSENGINRSYDSSDLPNSLLNEIVPFAKML